MTTRTQARPLAAPVRSAAGARAGCRRRRARARRRPARPRPAARRSARTAPAPAAGRPGCRRGRRRPGPAAARAGPTPRRPPRPPARRAAVTRRVVPAAGSRGRVRERLPGRGEGHQRPERGVHRDARPSGHREQHERDPHDPDLDAQVQRQPRGDPTDDAPVRRAVQASGASRGPRGRCRPRRSAGSGSGRGGGVGHPSMVVDPAGAVIRIGPLPIARSGQGPARVAPGWIPDPRAPGRAAQWSA